MDAEFEPPVARPSWQILLTKADAARALAIPEPVFETLVREGTIPPSRYLARGQVGWLVRELVEWAEAQPTSTITPPRAETDRREPLAAPRVDPLPPALPPDATAGDTIMFRQGLRSLLGVSSETIRVWIKIGRLPPPELRPTYKTMGWKISTLRRAGFPIQ